MVLGGTPARIEAFLGNKTLNNIYKIMEHHTSHDHSQHSMNSTRASEGREGHESHDKHAGHNVADFWKRFIISTIVSIPVLALSHMIQQWFGFELSFQGDKYVLAVLSTFIFIYGGYPFFKRIV